MQIDAFVLEGPPKALAHPIGAPRLFSRVDEAVSAAFERVCEYPSIQINSKIPFEWSLVEAGDNALRFIVYYHLMALPETKLTTKTRSHLRASSNTIVRLVFEEASDKGLDLSTPSLLKIDAGNLALVAEKTALSPTRENTARPTVNSVFAVFSRKKLHSITFVR